MFDRAYSTRLEEKQKSATPPPASSKAPELPLFYIALGLSVFVYLLLLFIAPSKEQPDDWFATIHNPNMHQDMTVASKSSANEIHR